MATDVNVDLEEVVEESETEESSPEVEETEERPKAKGRGAQDRIRSLNSEKKGLEDKLSELEDVLTSQKKEIQTLVDLVESKERDARTVARINEIYDSGDEKVKELIQNLDKLVRGEELELEEQIEEAESKGNEKEALALKKAKEELSRTKDEVREELEEYKAQQILDKADSLADSYLAELPDEYTEADKKILQRLLPEEIDWDAVEEDPSALASEFAKGFQSALDAYGEPRGKFSSKVKDETEKPETPEERIASIMNKDWGELKTVKTPSGDVVKPVHTEEDFNKALGEVLRLSNKR